MEAELNTCCIISHISVLMTESCHNVKTYQSSITIKLFRTDLGQGVRWAIFRGSPKPHCTVPSSWREWRTTAAPSSSHLTPLHPFTITLSCLFYPAVLSVISALFVWCLAVVAQKRERKRKVGGRWVQMIDVFVWCKNAEAGAKFTDSSSSDILGTSKLCKELLNEVLIYCISFSPCLPLIHREQ